LFFAVVGGSTDKKIALFYFKEISSSIKEQIKDFFRYIK